VGSAIVARRSERIAVSLFDWSLRRLLELLVLRGRSEREKEIEILLLRHELRVLERQVAFSATTDGAGVALAQVAERKAEQPVACDIHKPPKFVDNRRARSSSITRST
jgi:hypothetical protein